MSDSTCVKTLHIIELTNYKNISLRLGMLSNHTIYRVIKIWVCKLVQTSKHYYVFSNVYISLSIMYVSKSTKNPHKLQPVIARISLCSRIAQLDAYTSPLQPLTDCILQDFLVVIRNATISKSSKN